MSIGPDFRGEIISEAKMLAYKGKFLTAYLLLRGADVLDGSSGSPYVKHYYYDEAMDYKGSTRWLKNEVNMEEICESELVDVHEWDDSKTESGGVVDCWKYVVRTIRRGAKICYGDRLNKELYGLLGVIFPKD